MPDQRVADRLFSGSAQFCMCRCIPLLQRDYGEGIECLAIQLLLAKPQFRQWLEEGLSKETGILVIIGRQCQGLSD